MLFVWALAALWAATVFVTYSRLDPERLYHVSHEGVAGGASRLLVHLGFPLAVLAVPMLPLVVERLRRTATVNRSERGALAALALVAAGLCATVVVSVHEDELDARPLNAVTAAGTLLAAALTGYVVWRSGTGGWGRRPSRSTMAIVALLTLLALPWIAAEAGFSLDDVPLLGQPFNANEEAVHLGHHHGLDGVVLALAALVLWPAVAAMAPSRLRSLATFALALELTYGVANAIQDGWHEQVLKRGWTEVDLPPVLHPSPTPEWAAILLAAAAIWWLTTRVSADRRTGRAPRRRGRP